ncbi:MAG: diaminopimelate decarboxylase [Spirochaetia bacterium]|nr:diaminopimelate decarboxylase [Spirochaetia bacterium]
MYFCYKNDVLFWLEADLNKLCLEIETLLENKYRYNGPYYVYHADILRKRLQLTAKTLPKSRFFYSVKSLSNIHILKIIKEYENFGLDVVSEGEILRGILADFEGKDIVFAGVGKKRSEIIFGLEKNIKSFHVESIEELKKIAEIALSLGKTASVALRVNPNIEADTHEYIKTGLDENKFGLSSNEFTLALEIIRESSSLNLNGLQTHLGSQIKDSKPYKDALALLVNLAGIVKEKLSKPVDYLSLGGGFGIDYESSLKDITANDFSLKEIADYELYKNSEYQIDFEPGRFISGYSGILVSKVLYLKEKKDFIIAVVDSGMTDLIRPALYKAKHPILTVKKRNEAKAIYDIAGPICESSDYLAKKIELTELKQNDRLAVLHCGAYASTMGSNYNSRPLAPEFLIEEDKVILIRKPQSLDEMLTLEISANKA